MNFKRINYLGVAKKLSTGKPINYSVWKNASDELFIQLTKNGSRGQFSEQLFSVGQYKDLRNKLAAIGEMRVYDLGKKEFVTVKSNNNGAFVKAALRHLFGDYDGGKSTLIKDGKFNHEAAAKMKLKHR